MGNRGLYGFSTQPVPMFHPIYSLESGASGGVISTTLLMNPQRFTLSVWVRPRSRASGIMEVVSKRSYNATSTGDFPVGLYFNNTGTQATLFVDSGNDWNYDLVVVSDTLVSDVWYHLAGRYDGSVLSLFVNGYKKTSSGVVSVANGSRVWTLGRAATTGAESRYIGRMTDVRIFGVAKTDNEILDIMAGKEDYIGLWFWAKCSEGTGTALGNSAMTYNGTLSGTWTWTSDTP